MLTICSGSASSVGTSSAGNSDAIPVRPTRVMPASFPYAGAAGLSRTAYLRGSGACDARGRRGETRHAPTGRAFNKLRGMECIVDVVALIGSLVVVLGEVDR